MSLTRHAPLTTFYNTVVKLYKSVLNFEKKLEHKADGRGF